MVIDCIIVDDEPASRDILKKYISDCRILNLVAECPNAFEASEALLNNGIKLMFLDINMPKLSGIQFLKSISNPPLVIFTTAYPEYAVEGFEVNATDYLLKPFPFDRFLKAVNKASDIINSETYSISKDDYILFKADKKIHRVNINDITNFESLGDYVRVYFSDKSIIVHDTLSNLIRQVPESNFIRIHRSHVISLDKFDVIEGNSVKIAEQKIPIGQTYKAEFMKRIKNDGMI